MQRNGKALPESGPSLPQKRAVHILSFYVTCHIFCNWPIWYRIQLRSAFYFCIDRVLIQDTRDV